MSELPLNVQVAAALGCKLQHVEEAELPEEQWHCRCASDEHADFADHSMFPEGVRCYDTDSSAAASLIDLLDKRGWMVDLSGGGDSWAMWCSKGDCNCPHRKPYDEKDGHGFTIVNLDDWPDDWPEDEPKTWQRALCYMVLLLAKKGLL